MFFSVSYIFDFFQIWTRRPVVNICYSCNLTSVRSLGSGFQARLISFFDESEFSEAPPPLKSNPDKNFEYKYQQSNADMIPNFRY